MQELSCILLAGPNGSGKSYAFGKLDLDLEGVWINADEITKAIPSHHDARSADMQEGRTRVTPCLVHEVGRVKVGIDDQCTLRSILRGERYGVPAQIRFGLRDGRRRLGRLKADHAGDVVAQVALKRILIDSRMIG